MLRVEVSEVGQAALPPIDLEPPFVIGSAIDARVRLPASAAEPEHLRVDNEAQVGEGMTLEVGSYRIAIAKAPAGAVATPPQRTESLARELMRNLLGTAGAPTLEIASGPLAGAKRVLPPPDATLVIGRGDEAGWIIADDDLSRAHAEVRRTLDGVFVRDLDSKNGTKVDGRVIDGAVELVDGAEVALGKVVLRFRDPADRRVRAASTATPSPSPSTSSPTTKASAAPFYAAIAIMLVALAGLVWIVSS